MGGTQPSRCTPSPAEEQVPHRGRIRPLQGLQDANFSQKQRITAHQLQSILCRGRKQREKRNKKRFLSCGGFGGFVVFGMRKKKSLRKGWAGRAGGGTAGSPQHQATTRQNTPGARERTWAWDGCRVGTGWAWGAPPPPGTGRLAPSSPDWGICSKTLSAPATQAGQKVEGFWQGEER